MEGHEMENRKFPENFDKNFLWRNLGDELASNTCSINLLENHFNKKCNCTLTSTTKHLDYKKHLSNIKNNLSFHEN